jgi:hypothetical protein
VQFGNYKVKGCLHYFGFFQQIYEADWESKGTMAASLHRFGITLQSFDVVWKIWKRKGPWHAAERFYLDAS